MLGEEYVTLQDLMETSQKFFAGLYGQPLGTTMSEARYRIYSNNMRIMALPNTEANLYLHVRGTQLQMMLWKAADQQRPPENL